MPAGELKIGEIARRLGLNPRTIRFYEQEGVLPKPERTEAGYRIYGVADEERLRFIKAAQRLGLKLGEIKEVLAFRERGEVPCAYVAEVIGARLAEIDEQLRDLRTLKRELTSLQRRMAEEGVAPAGVRFCHWIEGGQ